MNRRSVLRSLGVGMVAAGAGGAMRAAARPAAGKPNIVYVMADDLGYGDVQCLNPKSRIPTPSFNRLAEQGMRFTDAHTGSAVCTPTRYGVLTGRYSWRGRLKRGVLFGYSPPLIERGRMTVASMLKGAGYATGCVGKWHLGLGWVGPNPTKGQVDYAKSLTDGPTTRGFDYFFGVSASLDMAPYVFIENDRATELPTAAQAKQDFPAYVRSGPRGPNFSLAGGLDTLVGKASDFIARSAKASKPFFLYFPLTAPHKPVLPAKRFHNKTKLGPYGDFITQVDWSIGQVTAALDKASVADNTLLIVSSDNGSFMYRLGAGETGHVKDETVQGFRASSHTSNHVFRGTKADIYEGGHHVPYLVRWPGKVKPGSTCDATICLTDVMATFADVAGATLPRDAGEDSFSTLELMLGGKPKTPRAPVVHHSANGTFAVRDGKWKLILSSGSGGREKPAGKPFSKPYRLFDMSADISETTDLASGHPEVVGRLTKVLETFQKTGRSRT